MYFMINMKKFSQPFNDFTLLILYCTQLKYKSSITITQIFEKLNQ